jgi:3-hydroxyisobutyrate dehydrogenase-like beta-hydroxyacid dehydrogenase
MGQAFALNLIADGNPVVVYDRDPERTRDCPGAMAATSLGDLANCDVVITSLPNDEALEAVALREGGLVSVMRAGAVHISMSTVSPAISRRVAKEHEARGQHYVAAPILGNPDLAQARKLFVLAAGPPEALEAAKPVLARLSQRIFVIGDDPGLGNLMKLAGNVLTATTLATMGEILALLRKGGIDQNLAFDLLTNSLFDSRVHRTYGGKIVKERYRPAGMVVPLAVKDTRLALAEAEREAVPMPFASLVHDRLVGVMAQLG